MVQKVIIFGVFFLFLKTTDALGSFRLHPMDLLIALHTSKATEVQLKEKLLHTIYYHYQKRDDVPYVFGGHQLGKRQECLECRKCIRGNAVEVGDRLSACAACRRCGMDCSSFVYHLFNRSLNLPIGFATTFALLHEPTRQIERNYELMEIPIEEVQTGDIVVTQKHMAVVLNAGTPNTEDQDLEIFHMSRFGGSYSPYKEGGFLRQKIVKDRFRGGILRSFRHANLGSLPKDGPFATFF